MPAKDPLSYSMITYVWVFGISLLGGIAGYIRKIKTGHCRFSVSELIGELVISGFVGVLTFFMCESAQMQPVLSAAFIGISGHMGSRAILIFEKLAQSRLEKWLVK